MNRIFSQAALAAKNELKNNGEFDSITFKCARAKFKRMANQYSTLDCWCEEQGEEGVAHYILNFYRESLAVKKAVLNKETPLLTENQMRQLNCRKQG